MKRLFFIVVAAAAVLALALNATAGSGTGFSTSGGDTGLGGDSGSVFSWDYRQNNLAAKGPSQAYGTFTNADAAKRWYQDPGDGLYKAAAANSMRFITTGGLSEPGATTLLTGTMPTTFTVAAGWNHSNLTSFGTSAGVFGPDGVSLMSAMIGMVANGEHAASSPKYARTNNVPYSFDIFVRPGNKTWIRVAFLYYDAADAYIAGSGVVAFFNLAGAGSIGSGTQTVDAAEIELISSGLYRCKIRDTYSNAVATKIQAYFWAADDNNDYSFAGDATTANVYFYGAYLRQTAFFDQPIFTGSASRTTESKFPQFAANAATLAALGAGGSGYVVWVGIPGFSSSVMTAGTDYGLINSADAANNLLYFDNDEFKSNDGANVRTVAGTFTSGTKILVAAKWAAGGNLQVGYSTNGTSMTWGTAGSYDGAFTTTGNTLYFANVMFGPLGVGKVGIHGKAPSSDLEILRYWN